MRPILLNMFHRLALDTSVLLLLLCSFIPSIAATGQPNILFIMVDDLGKDWISCYGSEEVETPHIDRLAEQGMRFENAWSMPQCTPTRVTLLTGQYPYRTGWVNHWDVPRWGVGYFDWREYTTFATVMKSAGYRTAIAGKWQINDFRVEPEALGKHGFDDWCVWTGYEAQNPPSAERYWDPYIHTREGSQTHGGQFGPEVFTEFLINYMKANQEHPMMLYFPMVLTHGPLVGTPDSKKRDSGRETLKGMVQYTDKLVGRMVTAIEDLGLREDTIVIFTTDNGTERGLMGVHNGVRPEGGKGTKYEGGVCQPFIVWGPGRVPEGVVTDVLTDFTDLLPTFAELGGATIGHLDNLDGHSIAPLLLGEASDSPREWILAMGHGPAVLDEQGIRGVETFTSRVLRDKEWKVWVDEHRQIVRLHHLPSDPLEQNNRIDEESEEARAALAKFKPIVNSMPKRDARPQYRKRQELPWDRKPSGQN